MEQKYIHRYSLDILNFAPFHSPRFWAGGWTGAAFDSRAGMNKFQLFPPANLSRSVRLLNTPHWDSNDTPMCFYIYGQPEFSPEK